ncbi:MAG: oligosaccharide flippase family protein [Ignavibacterium album]|uniref:oligosaccharide flippase family protein n=1 Tax=Ignavibacterium album TaxID=591197 RepID=UPI0026EFCCF1|nr:oligosaccharide flippase family protein [Ignavibacterium album]MBI5661140.1 oligosaccharide flippase family protein [Ignavibacterium album]
MNNKILKNILKGTLAITSGTVVTMAFHFLSIFFLARHLSQTEFGLYALIFSISNLLNLLSNLGLEISIVKNIVEGSQQRDSVLRPTLIIKSSFTVFILILYLFFYNFYPTAGNDGLWKYNVYIIILFLLGSFRDLFYRIIQGLNKFKQYSLIQISTAVLRVALIILSIEFEKFNFILLLYFEIIIIILALLLQFINIPFGSLLKGKVPLSDYVKLIKFSSPLYANNLITFTYDRVGVFIIGLLMTASSVAIYDVSTKIPSALQGILGSYILVFFPNISTLFGQGDNNSAEKLINKSIFHISFLLSSLTVIMSIWNVEIVTLFFSSKYIDSAFPLIIMMFSLLLRNLANILGYAIVAAGYSKIPLKVNLLSVIIGIASSLVFIMYWNYIGAAFAVLIMNFITLFQYVYYHRKLNLIKLNYSFSYNLMVAFLLAFLVSIVSFDHLVMKILLLIFYMSINYRYVIEFRNLFTQLKIIKSSI